MWNKLDYVAIVQFAPEFPAIGDWDGKLDKKWEKHPFVRLWWEFNFRGVGAFYLGLRLPVFKYSLTNKNIFVLRNHSNTTLCKNPLNKREPSQ